MCVMGLFNKFIPLNKERKCEMFTENNNKLYSCCFFGHRKITETDNLKKLIYTTVKHLIVNRNVNTFLFGSKSDFDDLCHKIVTELKVIYPHIKRIYVRAEFPYIDDDYKEYLLKSYEFTYYPSKIIGAGKAAYIERNYEMIDNSNFCVVYYDETYKPPKRQYSRKQLTDYQPQSGTMLAYHAAKKSVEIINVLNLI